MVLYVSQGFRFVFPATVDCTSAGSLAVLRFNNKDGVAVDRGGRLFPGDCLPTPEAFRRPIGNPAAQSVENKK